VAAIQSVILAAKSRSPVRAARIAAGPLAGAFLKLSPRRHQIPPPPAGVQPARSRAVMAASAGRVDRLFHDGIRWVIKVTVCPE